MEPTRADSTATTQRRSRGTSGRRCFKRSAGPMALRANWSAMFAGSSARMVFSGPASPICKAPVVTRMRSNVPASPPSTRSMLASMVRSSPSALRDRPTTSPRACSASARAEPMPPEAPMMSVLSSVMVQGASPAGAAVKARPGQSRKKGFSTRRSRDIFARMTMHGHILPRTALEGGLAPCALLLLSRL